MQKRPHMSTAMHSAQLKRAAIIASLASADLALWPCTMEQEKRKRDQGQASRGKNYVEEEKRIGRSLGVYSGFD